MNTGGFVTSRKWGFIEIGILKLKKTKKKTPGLKIGFDVGIVEPNSNSHSARSGCSQSFFNVNAGTRDEEREKVKRYKALCNQRGLTFVPIIFTTCGGMGEAFQRQIWHPHWKRVEAEEAEMKIT